MKRVKSSIVTRYFDKELPEELGRVFPHVTADQYSNGFVYMRKYKHLVTNKTLFCVDFEAGTHVKKDQDLEQMLTFTAGFRQYIHFHLHGIKQTLHMNMRKKVDVFERVIMQARRDTEGPKNWKEQRIGQSQEDRELGEEEEKKEEVYEAKK